MESDVCNGIWALTPGGEIKDNKPMQPPDRKEYLRRLIMGLEQTVENTKFEIPYYKPDDIQLIYAKKFLAAAEQSMAKAKKELDELQNCEKPDKKP